LIAFNRSFQFFEVNFFRADVSLKLANMADTPGVMSLELERDFLGLPAQPN
jgi:hypothetical protein